MKKDKKAVRFDGFHLVETGYSKNVDFKITGSPEDLFKLSALDLRAMSDFRITIISPHYSVGIGSVSFSDGEKSGIKKLKKACKKHGCTFELIIKSVALEGYWYHPEYKIRQPL